MLTALSMAISTIVLPLQVFLKGRQEVLHHEGALKKWLDRLADALKRLAGKAFEALPAIVVSVVGAILSFLGKTVGFVAEHTWTLIVFVVGLISVWLMQKAKNN